MYDPFDCEDPEHTGTTVAGPTMLGCPDCEEIAQDIADDRAFEMWRDDRWND